MAFIQLHSIICVQGLARHGRLHFFDRTLVMKSESVGHHAATQALVLSVAGVTAIVLIASLIFLILH
jgi:hypothetical protein